MIAKNMIIDVAIMVGLFGGLLPRLFYKYAICSNLDF